jgi:Homeodomain-like domain
MFVEHEMFVDVYRRDAYRWVGARPTCGVGGRIWCLVEDHRRRVPTRRYRPLVDEPTLFRTFADLSIPRHAKERRQGVLSFVERFGTLWSSVPVYVSDQEAGEAGAVVVTEGGHPRYRAPKYVGEIPETIKVKGAAYSLAWGEPLQAWIGESTALHLAVTLWDHIQAEDFDALGEMFEMGKASSFEYRPQRHVGSLYPETDPAWSSEEAGAVDQTVRQDLTDNLLTSAAYLLELIIAPRIRLFVDQEFFLSPEPTRAKEFSVSASKSSRPAVPAFTGRFETVPQGPIGAVWLQFLRAVTKRLKFGRCAVCDQWFVQTPATEKKGRAFCRDACRNKAFRERRKEAVRLHQEGKTPAAIAKLLGSDTKTVQGWVKGVKAAAKKGAQG